MVGNNGGYWEFNVVQVINGNSFKLVKKLEYSYKDFNNSVEWV